MSLAQHLRELRKRLMIAAAGLVLGMIVAFIITEPVIDLLTLPIEQVAAAHGQSYVRLNFDTVTSGFDLRMRIAFAIGLLLSAPVWLWQLWAFIMPALTRKAPAQVAPRGGAAPAPKPGGFTYLGKE